MARLTRGVLALSLIGMLAAGCGSSSESSSSSSTRVSASAYVTALCQAVAPFERDVARHGSELSGGGASSATAGKHELVSLMGALSADSAQAVAKLSAAGSPEVTGGARFAKTLLGTFTRLNTAMNRSRTQASALSTSSRVSFSTGATQIATAVKTSVGRLGAGLSTKGNHALDQAAAKVSACHAL